MAQRLETIIAINAQIGNGFSQVGATLQELGSIVNGISQQLIDFGKDSIEVYRNYEMSMKDAEVALSTTYGRGTRELQSVMAELDASATEWAATTIFHTNDVANAISEAAHAGWDLDQILTGIPDAIELAQAGSMDLSEAVNFIVKATNAAGIEFDQTGAFIDNWTFAANTSATTIEEMGEAMLKMGATMKFAGGTDELLVMLAELANAGTVGTEAGTLLRNSMIRLVAPTDKANKAMAQLGATSEESASLLNDEALAAANARLAQSGFSAYDENGEMKSMLDTYRDLYVALGDIAGGYDKIATNEESMSILSAIFPTRSITGALALLEAAGNEYSGLYEALKSGDAENYGEYAAQTMMDSLNGKIETFESKVERLKQVVGEELSGQVESILGTAGEFVDTLAGLDDGPFGAIVSSLETLALAGPGLLLAGGALRFIGTVIGGWPAMIGLSAIAVIALVNGLDRLNEIQFEENFGDLNLDTAAVSEYLATISEDFNSAYTDIRKFRAALKNAVDTYQEASGELKSDLLTNMVTGATLTEKQITSLNGLGEEIINAVKDGISENYAANMESVTNAFTIAGNGEITDPVWGQIIEVLNIGYNQALASAEDMGQRLRDAMTEAFRDGQLTGDEVAGIQQIMDEMNELMAMQQDVQNYVDRQRILRKGQTLGLDAIMEAVSLTKETRDAEWEELQDDFNQAYATTEASYDYAIKHGIPITNADGTGGEGPATEEQKNAALSALKESQEQAKRDLTASQENFILDTMMAGITESDLGDAWGALSDFATSFRTSGGQVTQGALNAYNESVTQGETSDLTHYLGLMVDSLGGYETIAGYADYFMSQGDETRAGEYKMIMDMFDILSARTIEAGNQGRGDYSETAGTYAQMSEILSGGAVGLTPESLVEHLQQSIASGFAQPDWRGLLGEDLEIQLFNAAKQAGHNSITEWVSEIETELGSVDAQMQIDPQVDQATLDSLMALDPVPLPITPHVEGEDAVEELKTQGVSVNVEGDTQQLAATIEGEDGRTLLEYVNGDATDLSMAITSEDGKTLIEYVTGDISDLRNKISSLNGQTIRVNIVGQKMFASGGRATTASIFGEAGPEWAIPEEHTERTAELLNAAREASGFTWADLLSRFGGMNANPSTTPTTIVYSPTINAADASGVEQVLRQDKERLFKMLEERKMLDEMEVYA